MPNLNRVLLMGHLTRDPELRATPRGTQICQFGLAINRDWKSEGGEKQTEVLFVDVEAWGKQAEAIAKYCTKGRALYVEGRLRLDQWEDKNTKEKRSRMKVVLEQFQFLGGKGTEQADPRDDTSKYETPRSTPPPAKQQNLDEDVPF